MSAKSFRRSSSPFDHGDDDIPSKWTEERVEKAFAAILIAMMVASAVGYFCFVTKHSSNKTLSIQAEKALK
jgi:hypothetical protein